MIKVCSDDKSLLCHFKFLPSRGECPNLFYYNCSRFSFFQFYFFFNLFLQLIFGKGAPLHIRRSNSLKPSVMKASTIVGKIQRFEILVTIYVQKTHLLRRFECWFILLSILPWMEGTIIRSDLFYCSAVFDSQYVLSHLF